MKINVLFLMLFLASSLFLGTVFQSCKADKLPPPDELEFCDTIAATYTSNVKAILDAKCATSSCHGGPQGPVFTDYSQTNSNSARIGIRAIDQQTMPPSFMPQLTNEELDILKCWRDAGFPEN